MNLRCLWLTVSLTSSGFSLAEGPQLDKRDFEYFNERLKAHTTTVRGDTSPEAISDAAALRSIVGFLTHGDYLALSDIDRAFLIGVNRIAVEEAAARPFWREICADLETGSRDIGSLANEVARAEEALESASEKAFRKAISKMSEQGQREIDGELKRTKPKMVSTRVDYVSLASDAPEVFEHVIRRFCRRQAQQPRDQVPPGVTTGDGGTQLQRDFGG